MGDGPAEHGGASGIDVLGLVGAWLILQLRGEIAKWILRYCQVN